MGEEQLLSHSSPSPQPRDYEIQENQDEPLEEQTAAGKDSPSPAHEAQSLEDGTVPEKKAVGDQDQEPHPSFSNEMQETTAVIETFKDDCIIPSPVLKGISSATFFGSDLPSALQVLGTRYNFLMKKCHEQNSKLEALEAECENQRSKCLMECAPKYEILKQEYARQCEERKRLYNELIEMKGNIRVFCRCRPLASEEISKGHTSILDLDPSQDTELQIICSDSLKKKFKFDHVFGPQDNQEAVFAETLPIVKSALDGYNVCIFAYGQTGTGKTFTMEGTSEDRGVNYRALEELFRSSKERDSMMRYEFSVSMLEVYNEKIRDLLAENSDPTKRLEIKQGADGTQDVPGLVEAQANSTDEVWDLLKTGGRNRAVGSTNANELSSRSHCLVRVTIKGEDLENGQRNRSHLWLVDLAGSERLGKIEVEGERLKESQFINKSLSALGDVISALASKNPHIPYRNSKLTHLLQNSLGGDCKTLMFVQISPSSADLGETLCSLNFASRVRAVEYGPARKQSDPAESFKLKQLTEKLRQEEKETARLNDSLQLMHLKYASRENVFKSLQEKIREAEQTCRNHQQKIRDLENQLADEKKARHQLEGTGSFKYQKPPLVPVKQRPPLSRITNRLPPPAPRSSITKMPPTLADKENILMTKRVADRSPLKPVMKAQRISLAPLVRHIPVQRKRRASIAVAPNETQRVFPEHQTEGANQFSQLRIPRRNSVVAFTPLRGIGTSLAAATPERKGKFSSIVTSSKYSSPPQMQAIWKSKIPTIASPRQRLRLVSSPASSSLQNAQMLNKLCFSVQKRVIIGSPAQRQHSILRGPPNNNNQALRDQEIVGKLGTAQRVLCSNRRKSVIQEYL